MKLADHKWTEVAFHIVCNNGYVLTGKNNPMWINTDTIANTCVAYQNKNVNLRRSRRERERERERAVSYTHLTLPTMPDV